MLFGERQACESFPLFSNCLELREVFLRGRSSFRGISSLFFGLLLQFDCSKATGFCTVRSDYFYPRQEILGDCQLGFTILEAIRGPNFFIPGEFKTDQWSVVRPLLYSSDMALSSIRMINRGAYKLRPQPQIFCRQCRKLPSFNLAVLFHHGLKLSRPPDGGVNACS